MSNDTGSSWQEPASPATPETPPEYGRNHVVASSECGHLIECDDTPGRERVRIQHGKSYSFIEMHPTGDVVHKIYGDNYHICAGRNNVEITGDCNLTVKGNYNLDVTGNYNLSVGGNFRQKVEGSTELLYKTPPATVSDGDLKLVSSGNIILSGQNVYVNSDMTVRGDISGTQNIHAMGNILADMTVAALLSLRTPGALFVGPVSYAMFPNEVVIPGYAQVEEMLNVGFGVTGGALFNVFGLANVTGVSNAIGAHNTIGTNTTEGADNTLGAKLTEGFDNIAGLCAVEGISLDACVDFALAFIPV